MGKVRPVLLGGFQSQACFTDAARTDQADAPALRVGDVPIQVNQLLLPANKVVKVTGRCGWRQAKSRTAVHPSSLVCLPESARTTRVSSRMAQRPVPQPERAGRSHIGQAQHCVAHPAQGPSLTGCALPLARGPAPTGVSMPAGGLEIPVQLIIVRQVPVSIKDILVQAFALYQRPLLKPGAIRQKELLQRITAVELDHLFQAGSPDRAIFDATAPIFSQVEKSC